jgi:dephospho-CoA kinase
VILGLTGHIASGKSTVSRFLASQGAIVIDADRLAREVVRPGSPLLSVLVERFGAKILTAEGCLDRGALGDIVFSDAAALQVLNGIMHPAIRLLAKQKLEEARRMSGVPLIIYDAALLFEVGADALVDKVLLVVVDRDVQVQRLMTRNGLGRIEALQRINAQQGLGEKLKKADFVIDNSGTVQELEVKLLHLWAQLVDSAPQIKTPDSA